MQAETIIFKIKRRFMRFYRGLTDASLFPVIRLVFQRKISRKSLRNPSIPPVSAIVRNEFSYPQEPFEFENIPRLVFQTWKSKTVIPGNYRVWRATFFRYNPTYNIVLWDDADNRQFITEKFPWFLKYYDRYPREIFRADVVRIFFLLYFGGFYADMDTECLRSLEPPRSSGNVILGQMGPDITFNHAIPNAMMASRPRQIFWLFVAKVMIDRLNEYDDMNLLQKIGPETFTGPIVLKRAFDQFVALNEKDVREECASLFSELDEGFAKTLSYSPVTLLSRNEWYPVDWTNPFHRLLRADLIKTQVLFDHNSIRETFKHSTMVTYWSHSWGEKAD